MPFAPESRSPILETERLVLRMPADSDAPALRDYYVRNDERFARRREARSHDLDQQLAWIRATAGSSAGHVTFLAFAKAAPDLVAVVTLAGFSVEDPPQAMLSYTVDGGYEGRGYASEAVRGVVGYARDERGLKALSAYYDADNARSERLLQRLGFVVVGATPVVPGFEKLMRAQVIAMLRLA